MNLLQSVYTLLEGEKICFLATCQSDKPHLSMMNYTYLPEEELIIISTRKNTKKFFNMQKNPAVALLIYRIPLSCTIYGRADVEKGQRTEFYRTLHLAHHRDMQQFISGPEIAIITIRMESAMTADLQDEVISWRAENN